MPRQDMPSEFNRTADLFDELRKHDDSITFLEIVRDSVRGVKDSDLRLLPGQMQRQGYYASVQGPWLVSQGAKSSMTLCCSLPKQLKCLPHPI